jgi:hypothetical protein
MNRATSVFQAANEWGIGVERYGINDVHPEGIALATSIMNNYLAGSKSSGGVSTRPGSSEITTSAGSYAGGGYVRKHSAGGTVNEPVFGFGANSGMPYSFAENGPEYVGPLSGNGGGNMMQPMTSYQGQQLIQYLQQLVTQGAQLPYNLSAAQKGTMKTGQSRGYFATGG